MANHPVPDNDPKYMNNTYGTTYLITDPRADRYLDRAYKQKLKQMKTITDAWTI